MENTNFDKLYKIISFVLMLVFLLFAFNAYWAFDYSSKITQNSVSELTPTTALSEESFHSSRSLLISTRKTHQQSLLANVNEVSAPLKFMVWPYERKQVSLDVVHLIRQQININPFNGNLWRQLSFVEASADIQLNDRAWTILNGVSLSSWNTSERILFTRHCVAEFERFSPLISSQCLELIKQLPFNYSIGGLSTRMGVKSTYLKWLLLSINVDENSGLDLEKNNKMSQ